MILPPLPQGYENKPWDYKGPIWIESQMRAYGELCIKRVCGAGGKYSLAEANDIRRLHEQGCGYKVINKRYPMAEKTYRDILNFRRAYNAEISARRCDGLPSYRAGTTGEK